MLYHHVILVCHVIEVAWLSFWLPHWSEFSVCHFTLVSILIFAFLSFSNFYFVWQVQWVSSGPVLWDSQLDTSVPLSIAHQGCSFAGLVHCCWSTGMQCRFTSCYKKWLKYFTGKMFPNPLWYSIQSRSCRVQNLDPRQVVDSRLHQEPRRQTLGP